MDVWLRSRGALALTVVTLLLFVPGAPALAQGNSGGGGKGGGGGGGGAPPAPEIVYVEQSNQGPSLKVMDADGANQTTVLASAGSSMPRPSWSPDGSEILFVSDLIGGWGICAIRPDGSGLRLIHPVTWDLAAPVWSPLPAADGEYKLLFEDRPPGQSNTDLFIVNLDGSGLVNLTSTPDIPETQPTWGPDAQRFAARVYHGSPGRTDILVYGLTNDAGLLSIESAVNITDVQGSPLSTALTVTFPSWARTSSRIALGAIDSSGKSDIWVIDLAAPATPFNLSASSNVGEQNPSWSRDDSHIVFRRDGSNKNSSGLYTMLSDGSGLTSLDTKNGRLPAWSRH